MVTPFNYRLIYVLILSCQCNIFLVSIIFWLILLLCTASVSWLCACIFFAVYVILHKTTIVKTLPKTTVYNMASASRRLGLKSFEFWPQDFSCCHNILPRTKFYQNQMIFHWNMEIMMTFKMAVLRQIWISKVWHLCRLTVIIVWFRVNVQNCPKIVKIWWFSLKYGYITIFMMAVVRHLGFYILKIFAFDRYCFRILHLRTKFRENRTI